MFIKVNGEVRFMVRVSVLLCCEDQGESALQFYGEAWVMSIISMRGQVQGPRKRLGLDVW